MSREGLHKVLNTLSAEERQRYTMELARSRAVLKPVPVASGGGSINNRVAAAAAKRVRSAPPVAVAGPSKKRKTAAEAKKEAATVIVDLLNDKKKKKKQTELKKAAVTAASKTKKQQQQKKKREEEKRKKKKSKWPGSDDDYAAAAAAMLAEGDFLEEGKKKKKQQQQKKTKKTKKLSPAVAADVVLPQGRPAHVPAVLSVGDTVSYAGKVNGGLTVGGAGVAGGQANFELVSSQQIHTKFSIGSGHYVYLRKKVFYKRSTNTLERFLDVICENLYHNKATNKPGVHTHAIPAAVFPEWLESARYLCDIINGVSAGDVTLVNTLTVEEMAKLNSLNLDVLPVNMNQYSAPPPGEEGGSGKQKKVWICQF